MADLLHKFDKVAENKESELKTTVGELRENPAEDTEDTFLLAERNRLVEALANQNASLEKLEDKIPGAPAGVGTIIAGNAGAAAVGLGVGSAASAAAGSGAHISATVRQVAREEALAVLEAHTAPRKPKSFSSVGNTEAVRFLSDLNFVQVDGNAVFEEELQLPDGTPACIGFDMSSYADEDAATGPLLAHHKQQLELLGARFGREGFGIYDVHSLTNDSLLIKHGNKAFKGIFDGCISPYGLLPTSALRQCRVVYEHRMPGALDACKGQAILALLAAYAYGPCPVLLDLTGGMRHIVYTIRGVELIEWAELTPTQAYSLQAQHLMCDSSRATRGLSVEQIPEEEQEWMRPMHKLQLRPESGLREQLESVIPFLPPDERMPAALELIHAWTQAARQQQQPALPM